MKKLGFGIIGLLLVASIYYFIAGSAQITEEMKKQVNNGLATLQQNGFKITDREIKESEEHFVISLDDPAKIASYLKSKGVELEQEEILSFKGFKVGVNAKYLNNSYSALSVDLYPIALPKPDKEDKVAMARIQEMIAAKTLLIHLDFNKLLSGFRGYVKDINETFEDGEKVNILSQGVTFESDIENGKIKTIKHKAELFSINEGEKFMVKLSNLKGHYMIGTSPYDIILDYSAKIFELQGEDGFSIITKNTNVKTINSMSSNLLKSSLSAKTEYIKIINSQKTFQMNDILFDFNIDNLDIMAFEALQKVDIDNTEVVTALTQKILSKNITLNIPKFSVKTIEENANTMEGFTLSSSLDIDKSFNINSVSRNPLAALDALSTKTHLTLSTKLFSLVLQEPKAMMMLMLFPPVEKEGKKVYDIEFIKGKLTVNGNTVF